MSEMDDLQELYDIARRSVERAEGSKLTALQVAEVARRRRLMRVIAADIHKLKRQTEIGQPTAQVPIKRTARWT